MLALRCCQTEYLDSGMTEPLHITFTARLHASLARSCIALVQGEGFSAGMQCVWSEPGNGTLAPVAATAIDSSSVRCVAPEWQPVAPSWQVKLDTNVHAVLTLILKPGREPAGAWPRT